MAAIFTQDHITDIEQLRYLSSHIMSILDKEAETDSCRVLLTPANVSSLNDLMADVISQMDTIVNSVPA